MEEIEKREKETRDWHLREVFAWVDLDDRDREQDDLLDRYVNNREEGTCNGFWSIQRSEHGMMKKTHICFFG
jgi:hypothetical protein